MKLSESKTICDCLEEMNYREPKIHKKRCGTCKFFELDNTKTRCVFHGKRYILVNMLYGICDNYEKE